MTGYQLLIFRSQPSSLFATAFFKKNLFEDRRWKSLKKWFSYLVLVFFYPYCRGVFFDSIRLIKIIKYSAHIFFLIIKLHWSQHQMQYYRLHRLGSLLEHSIQCNTTVWSGYPYQTICLIGLLGTKCNTIDWPWVFMVESCVSVLWIFRIKSGYQCQIHFRVVLTLCLKDPLTRNDTIHPELLLNVGVIRERERERERDR